MAAALHRCRTERLKRDEARERARRITQIDPMKDSTRVALVPIDSRAVGIPRDLRRTASYTTLYVLGTGSRQRARSRWIRVRWAVEWMIAYWRAEKLGMTISEAKLQTKETELIAPYANLIKVSPHSRSSHRRLATGNMSNVFAAPPIKYFLTCFSRNPNPITDPNPNHNPKNKRKQNDT